MPNVKRDELPYPWRWCRCGQKVRCDHCGQGAYPRTSQVAEKVGGYHYHASCALEIALEYLEDYT